MAGAAAAASIAILAAVHFNAAPRAAAPRFARGSNGQADIYRNSTPRLNRGLQNMVTSEPKVTFITDGDAIAVPLASDGAQVSIVRLYPTTTTERRWQRELSLSAGHAGQDGG
jgi:hypothetical protein